MDKKRLFLWYWAIALFVITFINYPSPLLPRDYKNLGYLFFGVTSLIIFGVEVTKKYRVYTLLIPLAAVTQHHLWAKSPFMQFLFFAVGMGNLFQFHQLTLRKELYRVIGIFCLLQCLWIWINYAGFDPHTLVTGQGMIEIATGSTDFVQPVIGSLGHWMVSGTFLLLSAPFLAVISPYLIVIPLLTSVVLPSAIFPTGLVAIIGFIIFKRYPKHTLVLSCLIGLAVYFHGLPTLLEPSERFKIWQYSLTKFNFNWIWGNGLGYFKDFFHPQLGNHFAEKHGHPHNEFIKILISFGLIGLAVIINCYKIVIERFDKDRVAGLSLIGSIVPMMAGFPLHTASTAIIMMVSFASILRFDKEEL